MEETDSASQYHPGINTKKLAGVKFEVLYEPSHEKTCQQSFFNQVRLTPVCQQDPCNFCLANMLYSIYILSVANKKALIRLR